MIDVVESVVDSTTEPFVAALVRKFLLSSVLAFAFCCLVCALRKESNRVFVSVQSFVNQFSNSRISKIHLTFAPIRLARGICFPSRLIHRPMPCRPKPQAGAVFFFFLYTICHLNSSPPPTIPMAPPAAPRFLSHFCPLLISGPREGRESRTERDGEERSQRVRTESEGEEGQEEG